MSGRPQSVAFWLAALALGLCLGILAGVCGYGVPVALATVTILAAVQLDDARRRSMERAAWRIQEALRRADISILKAALYMEMDRADLHKALAGERKLDIARLELLPDRFHQEHWPLIAEDHGVPALFNTFLKLQQRAGQ